MVSGASSTQLHFSIASGEQRGARKALEIRVRGAHLSKIAKGGAASAWEGVNNKNQSWGGWPGILVLPTSTTKWVPRSCVLCKGGYHGRLQ